MFIGWIGNHPWRRVSAELARGALTLSLIASPLACGPKSGDETTAGSDGTTGGSDDSQTGASDDATSSATSSTADDGTSASTADSDATTLDSDATTLDSDATSATTDAPTTGVDPVCVPYEPPACAPAVGTPGAASCVDDDGCGPGEVCFLIPALAQGLCSECTEDADCPGGGCTIPNPSIGSGAFCNPGAACDGCTSDAGCNDPEAARCGLIFDFPGIVQSRTCSECASDDDCPGDQPNCAPVITDLFNLGGVRRCVADCSLADGQACELGADHTCLSGHCSVALIAMVYEQGVCGECTSDADCDAGQTCLDAFVDLEANTLVGATCL